MNIILAITSSISAYKSYDLLRELIRSGNDVKVILTNSSESFVHKNMFHQLGASDVFTDSDEHRAKNIIHIDLGVWADKLVIAPLSANTLSKFAHGLADNLLTCLFLAFPLNKPILLFKAMNTRMLENPIIKNNEKTLTKNFPNLYIHPSVPGKLACGEVGLGKLASPIEMAILTETWTINKSSKTILLANGATKSPLDPVRFLTNPSSGKTGYIIAKESLKKGHSVTMVCGPHTTPEINALIRHPNFELIEVETAAQMERSVLENFKKSNVYISPAAICDIQFTATDNKIKKSDLNGALQINQGPDILEKVINNKSHDQIIVGFAAETNLSNTVLTEKWNRKPVDLLIGTKVSYDIQNNSFQGFRADSAYYNFFKNGHSIFEGTLKKEDLAKRIFQEIDQCLN